MTLPPLMARFVQEMLLDPSSATAAYKRAGGKAVSEKSISAKASRMVADGRIQVALKDARESRERRVAVRDQKDGDWVLKRLIENVERCMKVIPVYDPLTGRETGEYQYDAAAANAALNMLAKHFGLYEKDNRQKAGVEDLESLKAKLLDKGIDLDRIRARGAAQAPSAN